MITSWHMIPLYIGTKQIAEIEVKLDLAYTRRSGWEPIAVLVEDLDGERMNSSVRIEADGSVANGELRERSLIGPAVISAASHYYSAHKHEVLEGVGLVESAE